MKHATHLSCCDFVCSRVEYSRHQIHRCLTPLTLPSSQIQVADLQEKLQRGDLDIVPRSDTYWRRLFRELETIW